MLSRRTHLWCPGRGSSKWPRHWRRGFTGSGALSPLLRVRGAGWRARGLSIIDGIDFDVSTGELVAVMGKNGAGKTTLLDLIAGLCGVPRPVR